MKKDLIKIINYFGEEKQCYKFIEEAGEMISAFSKFKIDESHFNKYRLVEEMSDTLLMIEQMCLIHNIKQIDIDEIKTVKIDRTLGIIKSRRAGDEVL